MVYNIFVEGALFDENVEFDSAMSSIDNIPMTTEVELVCVGESPITTIEEAMFFCESANEEMYVINQMHRYGRTAECALKNIGRYPSL